MEYGGDADHRKPGNARSTIQEFGQSCFRTLSDLEFKDKTANDNGYLMNSKMDSKMGRVKDLTGMRFGMLTVLGPAGRTGGKAAWLYPGPLRQAGMLSCNLFAVLRPFSLATSEPLQNPPGMVC